MSTLTDRQLVTWAVSHGWTYFHSNDQLRDPGGYMTTAHRWERIGEHRRQQILEMMSDDDKAAAAISRD